MIVLWLFVGIVICGLKFPIDYIRGENANRYAIFNKQWWGLKSGDPKIEDAIARIRAPGRTSHDLTNLPIEIVRYWIQTWEPQRAPDEPNATPGIVKGLCSLIVWPWIIFFLYKVIMWMK